MEELVVQHQDSGGTVTEERIGLVSSYSFEWRKEVHSVTVKAQNSQGYSTRNINMTLERHPKRKGMYLYRAEELLYPIHRLLVSQLRVSSWKHIFENTIFLENF